MFAAIKSVKNESSGINQAALLHEVPKTTLKNRLSGRVVHGTKPGPRRYLNSNEETSYQNSFKSVPQWVMGKQGKMF